MEPRGGGGRWGGAGGGGPHLEAFLDFVGQPDAGAGICGEVQKGQALLQSVLRDGPEHSVLSRAESAGVEGDVVCNRHHLRYYDT
jgi:hypothetical protein